MKKISLVLDLSSALYLGIVDEKSVTLAYRIRGQGTRGESAHALLDECLAEAGMDVSCIADMCVGVGPGSFTGIRVCAALAQGLAFPAKLPLFPFSSLAAMAACALLPKEAGATPASSSLNRLPVVAAIAANSGRYYVRNSKGEEALLSADDLLGLGDGSALVTSGTVPDLERVGSRFASIARMEDLADFGHIAKLAHSSAPVTNGILRPNYLMLSAAEEKRNMAGETPR